MDKDDNFLQSLKLMDSGELSTMLSEKEKEIMQSNDNLAVVNNEVLYIDKKMIELQGKLLDLRLQKKQYQLQKNKAKNVYDRLSTEGRIIKNALFSVRGQGR